MLTIKYYLKKNQMFLEFLFRVLWVFFFFFCGIAFSFKFSNLVSKCIDETFS